MKRNETIIIILISVKIQDYMLAVGHIGESGDYNIISEFMEEIKPCNLSYRILDFNKDGIPELFIANPNGRIYAAYTLDGGKAVYLMSSMLKYKCVLCKNGIIERWVEGGDGGSVWVDRILKADSLNISLIFRIL